MANFPEAITLIGVNHKTAPLELRERLACNAGYDEPLAALAKLTSLREYYLLSTCNRVEIAFVCTEPEQARAEILNTLFAPAVTAAELRPHIYQYEQSAAVEHLFRVAASLDSMVVGEAQILGQLKEAYRVAAKAGGTGPLLNKLLHKSFSVAKRVRTETRIGASAVSISYAAVELGRKIFGDFTNKHALLIGAGEMAELAAEHLLGNGVASIMVANRTLARAVNLARRFKGKAIALDELHEQLQHADVIISSTGAAELILRKEDVRQVMRRRRNRPLFFIDIAVPRDLDPTINELDNVYLYDIDDLQGVVELNRADRDREAVKAGRIIAEEVLKFEYWLENMASIPTIIQLRTMIENIVLTEVEKSAGRIGAVGGAQLQALEKMALAITSRMLYHPLKYLKEEQHCLTLEERINTVRSIFELDDAPRPVQTGDPPHA